MTSLFKRIFHPNKTKREKEEQAEEQRRAINQQAAQERETARIQKENNLADIAATYARVKEEITVWHQTELSKATESYNQKQNENTRTLNDLNSSREQYAKEITENFNLHKANLLESKQNDEQHLEECFKYVTQLAEKNQELYGSSKVEIEELWEQAKSEMLGRYCIEAYKQLKQPTKESAPKNTNYSLLVGYLRQLSEQQLISDWEFERYSRFFYTLYNSNHLEQNDNFNVINDEILNLLHSLNDHDLKTLSNAYQTDRQKHIKTYLEVSNFDDILYDKVVVVKNDIFGKYEQLLLDLISEHDRKQQDLQQTIKEVVQQITTEWNKYKNKWDAYIETINNSQNSQLAEINAQETQEKIIVNEQYKIQVQSIEQTVSNKLQEIQTSLEVQLKQLKHSRRAGIINTFTTVVAGAAAYFSGGLLSGVSGYVVQSVQSSLAATSLRALERLVNSKDKIGFEGAFNLGYDQSNDQFNPKTTTNRTSIEQQALALEEQPTNLRVFKEQLTQFGQKVHFWQTTAEHNLFYLLHREVSPINANFSEALTRYSTQNTNNNFWCKAQLGQLQADGSRSIEWSIMQNNQSSWCGRDVMRDRDICNIMQRLSNISSDLFKPDRGWHKPQVLQFEGGANNTIADNNSNRIKSLAIKTLDFFMPAAYSDELSVSVAASNQRPITDFNANSYLNVGMGEKLLILSGGAFKNVERGIKQGSYMIGERLGIFKTGTSAHYTDRMNSEMQLYNNTPVGKSKLRPWVEFTTEMSIYSVIPAASYSRMGLVANSALTGGITCGSQFVEDGKLSSRAIKLGAGTTIGAGGGIVVNRLRGPMLKLFNARNSSNIFKQSSELNWNFVSRLEEQLLDPRLGALAGKLNSQKILKLAHNPKANFFLDKNTGHINIIQKVKGISGKSLRITVIRDEQKIISVGVVRDTSLLQYTSNNSRYVEIGVKKISKPIIPRVTNE